RDFHVTGVQTCALPICFGELVFILGLGLLVLGPRKLPELARGIGRFMREFRRQSEDIRHTVEREFYKMDRELEEPLPKLGPPEEIGRASCRGRVEDAAG